MDQLTRVTLTFSGEKEFEREFEKQWSLYLMLYPTHHEYMLREIVFNTCRAIVKGTGEHFIDLKFPEFSFSFGVNVRPKRYLICDDLSPQLRLHPIHIPIPDDVKDDAGMVAFTIKAYNDLMSLGHFDWDHSIEDIIIDGFDLRFDKIYPSISN